MTRKSTVDNKRKQVGDDSCADMFMASEIEAAVDKLTLEELSEAAAIEVMAWDRDPGYESKYYLTPVTGDWNPSTDDAQALRVWLRAIEIIGKKDRATILYADGLVDAFIDLSGGVSENNFAYYGDTLANRTAEVLTRCAVIAVRERKQQAKAEVASCPRTFNAKCSFPQTGD